MAIYSTGLLLALSTWASISLFLGPYQGVDFLFGFPWSLFVLVLVFIFMLVETYQRFYLKALTHLKMYALLMRGFLCSMVVLLSASWGWLTFWAWEGLGVTSASLVAYYKTCEAANGALWTILSSRVGDACLFSGLILNLFNLKEGSVWLFILAGATKSAQWPWGVWLTKAMSAPTPTSSLVHSSTLVTAGVVIIPAYLSYTSSPQMSLFLTVGFISLWVSSVTAIREKDSKKIVALSTMSQISLCAILLGLGSTFLGLFHLLSHAFFKSALFLSVGARIHKMWGEQETRNQEAAAGFTSEMVLLVALLNLVGLTYSSGMVSKELLLETSSSTLGSWMAKVTLVGSFWATLIYSVKLGSSTQFSTKTSEQSISWLNMASGAMALLASLFWGSAMVHNSLPAVGLSQEEGWVWALILGVSWLKYRSGYMVFWQTMAWISSPVNLSSPLTAENLLSKGYINLKQGLLSPSWTRTLSYLSLWPLLSVPLLF